MNVIQTKKERSYPSENEERRAFIRPARTSDAEALRDIYAFYVENTTVSFEYNSPTVEEFSRRIQTIQREYPYLVYCLKKEQVKDAASEEAAQNGEMLEEIVGFAYAHAAFERIAYSWDAEISVYIDRTRRGAGAGSALYRALIPLLRRQGVRNLYAVITSENKKSVAFHLKNDFQLVGTLRGAGFKDGRWLDVDRYERQIGEFDLPPEPFVPFSRLDEDDVANICADSVRRDG